MKKSIRSKKQGRPRMSDHNIDVLDIGRIYHHPDGGMIELVRSRNQITITAEDGSSVTLSIGSLGCIALGRALQVEGETWLSVIETTTDKDVSKLALAKSHGELAL